MQDHPFELLLRVALTDLVADEQVGRDVEPAHHHHEPLFWGEGFVQHGEAFLRTSDEILHCFPPFGFSHYMRCKICERKKEKAC